MLDRKERPSYYADPMKRVFLSFPARSCLAALLMVFFLSGRGVLFAHAGAPSSPPDEETDARIAHIQRVLDEGQAAAERWWFLWTAGFGVSAAINLAGGATSGEREDRGPLLVNGTKSLLAMAGLLLDPMVPAYAPGRLRAMPEETAEERRKKLVEAERLMEQSAAREKRGTSWGRYGLSLFINILGAAILLNDPDVSSREKRNRQACLGLAAGVVAGTAAILTQPTRAVDDWRDYREKYGRLPSPAHDVYRRWFITVHTGGIIAGMRF